MTSSPPPEARIAGRALRILIVSSDTYPPRRVDVTVLFGEELARNGHRIDCILQSDAACDRTYEASWGGGTIWVGPTDLGTSLFARIRKHARGILHDLKLFSLVKHGRYDFLEVKDKFISGVFAMLAARLHRVRFIYWLSWPFPEEYLIRARDGTARYPFLYLVRGSVFKFLLYRVLMRAADHVFVQSEQMRKDVAAEGIPLEKITAVPMGVRIGAAAFEESGAPRGPIPADVKSLLYLGTLSKVRRMDFLIRVLALVRRDMPEVKLYLVGRGDDPADEQILIEEARRLNQLDALVMVGQLPQPQAFAYVRDADLCLSPFYPTPILNSTSPTKLVEYMAMGKAVVANDHPEQRLVIEQSQAGLCVPYEEGAFAKAILELLPQPQVREEMGRRGRRYVETHRSYTVIAQRVERQLLQTAGLLGPEHA